MSIYIYDNDALERMIEVEGAAWGHKQETHRSSPFGFYAFVEAWKELQEFLEPDEVWEDNIWSDGGDGAIYGEEGYSRYTVHGDGEIVLLAWSTRQARRERAAAVGFRVIG